MNQPDTLSDIQPQPPESGESLEGQHGSAARFAQERQGQASIAGDVLHGPEAIAEFLYGDAKQRRRVYNLIDGGSLPHFRLVIGIYARKSVLMTWIK